MSTALEILNVAYRDHNLQEISSFSNLLDFPYNIAKDVLNEVIRELNRLGNFWFTETTTVLNYSPGSNTYSFRALGIDPQKVIRLRKESSTDKAELKPCNWKQFQQQFRQSALQTGNPSYWSKFGDVLELNCIPDQDYSLSIYHYQDMPMVTATTDSQSNNILLVPENDEDLLERGCYFYLGYKIGKWDYGTALQLLRAKALPFLVAAASDSSMPSQMPSNF